MVAQPHSPRFAPPGLLPHGSRGRLSLQEVGTDFGLRGEEGQTDFPTNSSNEGGGDLVVWRLQDSLVETPREMTKENSTVLLWQENPEMLPNVSLKH